jgi:hypothetical protein
VGDARLEPIFRALHIAVLLRMHAHAAAHPTATAGTGANSGEKVE